MYHIREADTKEERSLHMENARGMANAIKEARMRVVASCGAFEIVDDDGKLYLTIEPSEQQLQEALRVPNEPELEEKTEVVRPPVAKKKALNTSFPWNNSWSGFVATAWVFSLLLYACIFGR